jgi:hypothetical protein
MNTSTSNFFVGRRSTGCCRRPRHILRLRVLTVIVALIAATQPSLGASSDTESKKITGPVYVLSSQDFGFPSLTDKPYSTGEITVDQATAFIRKMIPGNPEADRPTIIHILQWSDASHTSANFQQWYVWNPHKAKMGGFYALSDQTMFEGTLIPGETEFRLIFIHLNSKAPGSSTPQIGDDSFTDNTHSALKIPITYDIDITKEPSQLLQDAETLLKYFGVPIPVAPLAPASSPTYVGYWGWADFSSKFSTSSIKITPSSQKITPTSTAAQPNKATDSLTAKTYTNEGLRYVGLSVAVPVKSYKDVTYQSSSGSLAPTTVTKQNVYGTVDFYLPPALPGLMAVRYIPHAFVGVPFEGKVFKQPMAGLAVGLPWLQVFGGEVFDRDNGPTGAHSKTTTHFVFGVKISVSAAMTALKSASK